MCECPGAPTENQVHIARDFCGDKHYLAISLQDLFKDLKEILEYNNEKFDYAIEATEAMIEGKPFVTGGQKIENIPEYTLAELGDIKNGFGRSLGLLQFFLGECLLTQDQSSGLKPSGKKGSSSRSVLTQPRYLAGS